MITNKSAHGSEDDYSDLDRQINQISQWLNKAQAAQHLNCNERFIERLIAERRIPFHRLGGKLVRLSTADLDAFAEAGRVEAVRRPSEVSGRPATHATQPVEKASPTIPMNSSNRKRRRRNA